MTTEKTTESLSPGTPDWFLVSLVQLANAGVNFGLTLQVSGLLVTGTLVGGKEYFEGFADQFANALGDTENAAEVRKSFAQHGEIYKQSDEEEAAFVPPTYIHLKGAKFFNTSGSPVPSNGGVWWRGRISEVSGFFLGSLSKD